MAFARVEGLLQGGIKMNVSIETAYTVVMGIILFMGLLVSVGAYKMLKKM